MINPIMSFLGGNGQVPYTKYYPIHPRRGGQVLGGYGDIDLSNATTFPNNSNQSWQFCRPEFDLISDALVVPMHTAPTGTSFNVYIGVYRSDESSNNDPTGALYVPQQTVAITNAGGATQAAWVTSAGLRRQLDAFGAGAGILVLPFGQAYQFNKGLGYWFGVCWPKSMGGLLAGTTGFGFEVANIDAGVATAFASFTFDSAATLAGKARSTSCFTTVYADYFSFLRCLR